MGENEDRTPICVYDYATTSDYFIGAASARCTPVTKLVCVLFSVNISLDGPRCITRTRPGIPIIFLILSVSESPPSPVLFVQPVNRVSTHPIYAPRISCSLNDTVLNNNPSVSPSKRRTNINSPTAHFHRRNHNQYQTTVLPVLPTTKQTMPLTPLPPVLGEGAGWFMVIGFGMMFTILTMFITKLEKSLLGKGTGSTTEEFATAGRNLGRSRQRSSRPPGGT